MIIKLDVNFYFCATVAIIIFSYLAFVFLVYHSRLEAVHFVETTLSRLREVVKGRERGLARKVGYN